MNNIISVSNLNKIYSTKSSSWFSKLQTKQFEALKNINLEIKQGEIFALLGPNGAGKTTLINTVCGILNSTSGQITVGGFDIKTQFRQARKLVGLVPQELTTDAFETVWNTVSFSRGLFGEPKNPAFIEEVLKSLSLWDKKDNKLITLSGGMKRRVMIAKALSHEPKVLFLDEPSAGVDVELRKSMWGLVHKLRESGVTIILTTHYIEEAEEMSDRVGVINKGQIILIEEKKELMKKLGKKELILELQDELASIPSQLNIFNLILSEDKKKLTYTYDTQKVNNGVADLFDALKELKIRSRDLSTKQSSLEEIFVQLVHQ
jgi:ABC-2 type transport system ATP-binding protein